MEQRYLLRNLDCPHCAAKIESKVAKADGVQAASVDYLTKRLTLTSDGTVGTKELITRIEAIVKSIEPGIVVEVGKNTEVTPAKKVFPYALARLVVAAAVYAAGYTSDLLHAPFPVAPILFAVCLAISGGLVFVKAARNITVGQVFDENLLMSIASIAAFAIGWYPESAAVMLFYQIGEYFQELATERSKKSVTELMDLRPDYANLKTDTDVIRVEPEKVQVGDLIEVRPGERVPLDGIVLSGNSFADTAALTGEPVPRALAPGDSVTGGFVNKDGLLTVRVEKPYGESTVAKIIDLVENAGAKKAKAENFITKFARYYTPAVTVAALLLAVLPPLLLAQPFGGWVYRAIIFLVVSCPCALVVSVPLGFFAGIGAASRNGILVKGGSFLEKLATVDTIVFDKTGTITKGVFEVTQTDCAPGITEDMLLEIAALAQSKSSHPIAKSILRAAKTQPDTERVGTFIETAGFGVTADTDVGQIAAGNERLMAREGIVFTPCEKEGTLVYVARDKQYIGCIVIADSVKNSAADAVRRLKTLGVKKTVMLTGDRPGPAQAAARAAGIDEFRAGLMPDEKVAEFERLSEAHIAAFVGDGINDAPVLARADIGIAMGGVGSDAAVEAADIVIMDDDPARIATAVRISRAVRAIVRQNIVIALGVKFAVLLLGAFGIASIWTAVFADTGVALVAVLNSMRILIRRDSYASSK